MIRLLAGAAVLAADRIMKNRIECAEPGSLPRETAGGKVILTRTHNYGFAFNRMDSNPALVKAVTTAAGVICTGLVWKLSAGRDSAAKLGAALITAGAVSNVGDRWKWGYVVDYISFPFGKLRRISFNIADFAVIIGALLSVH